MSSASLAIVPILAIVAATAYRRSLTSSGKSPGWRQRIVFSLAMFGIMFPALGLALRGTSSASLSAAQWLETGAALIVVGATPLAVFLAFDIPLRQLRRWEASRSNPARPS